MARTSSDTIDCRQPVRETPCCPDCGALECLCRPRFFAGQLLSEQDLNRLDQYIRNKNRLHNRNQHGWGVVNGLLVVCDPCGDIKVTQGYAVDPCGDDIVVCEDTRVNICELIRKCREPPPECQPFRQPANSNCDDLEEVWVLTIRYREWASRGVTALRGNSCATPGCNCASAGNSCDCGGGCGCAGASRGAAGARREGGGNGGSCGCSSSSGAGAQRAAGTAAYRGAPVQCEATVTCEGYSFDVYKKPDTERDDDDGQLFRLGGAFWEAFSCCAEPLLAAVPPMPDLNSDGNIQEQALAVSRWCCQFRDKLLKYFLSHRNTRCEIIDHLRAINCPSVNSPNSLTADFAGAFLQLMSAWAEGIKNCLCLSLLPPPPQATCDLRVPLATVRIRARDCHILSICNWTSERRIMVTWPTVGHWLGIVPIGDFIRELLDCLCCTSLLNLFEGVLERFPDKGGAQPIFRPPTTMADTTAPNPFADTGSSKTFHTIMGDASGALAARFGIGFADKIDGFAALAEGFRGRGAKPLELGALLNALSPRFKIPDNGQHLNDVEAKNLPLVVMAEVLVKPVLGTFLGSGRAAERVAEFQAGLSRGADKTARGDDAQLRAQVDEMRSALDRQERQIAALMKKLEDS